jgi:catechol 2,3-dioxygenase-like lactoylglutathione lyase family enzyme
MKMRLHHVNVVGDNMEDLNSFYRDVLGLPELPMIIEDVANLEDLGDAEDEADAQRRANASMFNASNAAFYNASGQDDLQLHLGLRQPYLGARLGHAVNPVVHGHFAFRTDDLNAVRKQLDEAGVLYSDYGEWVIKGWDQIFMMDPAGNVVEIHQVASDDGPSAP